MTNLISPFIGRSHALDPLSDSGVIYAEVISFLILLEKDFFKLCIRKIVEESLLFCALDDVFTVKFERYSLFYIFTLCRLNKDHFSFDNEFEFLFVR